MDTSLDYSRRLHDLIMEWYRSADSKAQVVIAIDGAFIGITGSKFFAAPNELKLIVTSFNALTWLFLFLLIVALLGSIGFALFALWSRLYSKEEVQDKIAKATKAAGVAGSSEFYPTPVMHFFQFISALEDTEKFIRTLSRANKDYELTALAHEIRILSSNVTTKHRAINRGFLLTAVAMILLFGVAINYAIAVVS